MFWTLALAHFLADYPLLPDRLAAARHTRAGLAAHVTIHLLAMLALSGAAALLIWPYLLLVAASHLVIDVAKTALSLRRPRWLLAPYVGDQALHLLAIAFVARTITQRAGANTDRPWILYAIAYLFATHVWFITERVLAGDDAARRAALKANGVWRMGLRALLLTAFLLLGRLPAAALAVLLLIAAAISLPYRHRGYPRRRRLLDLLVPLAVALILFPFMPR